MLLSLVIGFNPTLLVHFLNSLGSFLAWHHSKGVYMYTSQIKETINDILMLPITHLNAPGSRVAMWMGDGGIQSYFQTQAILARVECTHPYTMEPPRTTFMNKITKVLYTPYISRGFYFCEFRESGAIREFNNTQKYMYLPPIPTHECDLCTQY